MSPVSVVTPSPVGNIQVFQETFMSVTDLDPVKSTKACHVWNLKGKVGYSLSTLNSPHFLWKEFSPRIGASFRWSHPALSTVFVWDKWATQNAVVASLWPFSIQSRKCPFTLCSVSPYAIPLPSFHLKTANLDETSRDAITHQRESSRFLVCPAMVSMAYGSPEKGEMSPLHPLGGHWLARY